MPVDLGDDFYANIENQENGCYLTNENNNLVGRKATGKDEQIWHFIKNDNGTYRIESKKNGGVIDVEGGKNENNANVYVYSEYVGGSNQQFYIYERYGAYNIRPRYTSTRVLDVNMSSDNNVEIWEAAADRWHGPQSFTIQKCKCIEDSSIVFDTDTIFFDGTEKKPGIVVKLGNITLVAGNDYTLSYENNVNVGTAKVIVTGKGNYTGTVEKNFTISKAPQSVTAELSVDTIHESGTAQITASGHGTIRYQSSNEDIAAVDSSGAVTGKSVGTATIVVSAEDDPNYQSASKSVTIVVTHDFDSGVVTQKASCTEGGVRTYTCAACEKTYTEVIPATGHDYGEKATAPTCTERGYTTHTCRNCDDSYQDSYTDALGHDYDDGEVTKEATGDEPGTKTYTCTRCNTTKTEELPPKGHHYDEGQVTEKATCTQDGIRTFTCTDAGCGKTYTEVIPATGHNYETKVTAPTCTKKGYTTHTCSACKDSYRDSYVDALGHEYDDGIVMEEPNCEEEGLKEFTCTRCKKASYTTVIPAAGHKYTEKVTAPTCTKKGYTTHTCSVCKSSYKDQFTDATGHHFDKEKVIDAATCKEEGEKTYTCTACGKTRTQKIAIDPENHSWDEGTITVRPTETKTGIILYTCTVCHATKEEVISNLMKPNQGDFNGDHDITMADVIIGNQAVVGLITLTPQQKEAADVTGDHDYTMADVVKTNRYVLGKIHTL